MPSQPSPPRRTAGWIRLGRLVGGSGAASASSPAASAAASAAAGGGQTKIKAAACLHNGRGSKEPPSHPNQSASLISAGGRQGDERTEGGREERSWLTHSPLPLSSLSLSLSLFLLILSYLFSPTLLTGRMDGCLWSQQPNMRRQRTFQALLLALLRQLRNT